ncbi:type I DNA topoisomerase [Candidatus Sumerlaeota bacterium]|nr:type I DNA topoisomerase [Candidatus Sumerlaeota bacterium]
MTKRTAPPPTEKAAARKAVKPPPDQSKKPRATDSRKSAKSPSSSVARGTTNLVIVESPAKARTIEKYLGKGFKVQASVGHIMDLPEKGLGVDIENDFEPEYVATGRKDVLRALKTAAAKADAIYLCTDPDREGEAIAWHIVRYLDPPREKIHRATFNEITQKAVRAAIENPRQIDDNLCMAQQTRRILDRLVGYKISPLLIRKVRQGLSAGRVQSVAVRLLCDREAEIEAFQPEEYWSVEIDVEADTPPPFRLKLAKIDDKKANVPDKDQADAIVRAVRTERLAVGAVVKEPHKRSPQPPFITSSLQQEAARKLRFAPSHTSRVAQALYEGVELGAEGSVGLITYMRTDSTRIADSAVEAVREFIGSRYGAEYLPAQRRTYPSKKGAQDAHEAIRPTLLDRPPESVAAFLSADQKALYELIWNRFVACQMRPAELERTRIEAPVRDGKYLFAATGSVVTFPGFLAVYEEGHEKEDEEKTVAEETSSQLPSVSEGETLKPIAYIPEQHFTQPPPRFSMSSLIRELERRGIGRPSTYVSILSTIQNREYVARVKGYFRPTDLGRMVTSILIESFPEILDIDFTANMEKELDDIEEGQRAWLDVLGGFYRDFEKRLDEASRSMRSPRGEEQETDIECEKCGSRMVVKWGRNGHFLACSKYPECRNTRPYETDEEGNIVSEPMPSTDETCDRCGAPMTARSGPHGPFLSCTNYPDCKHVRQIAEVTDGKAIAAEAPPETDEVCEKCGAKMVVKTGRNGPFLACSAFPKCRNAKNIGEVRDGKAVAEAVVDTGEVCDKCNSPMIVKTGKRGAFLACSAYPKCRNTRPLEGGKAEALGVAASKAPARPKPVETDEKCPNCGKPMVLRRGRHGPFLGCSGYPKCKTVQKASPDIVEKHSKEEG